jgi:nitroimidazol reductase NimA-like FMN-containing flavoprotein (pyridoxamine 5'-phosphate oxidase superfamily)
VSGRIRDKFQWQRQSGHHGVMASTPSAPSLLPDLTAVQDQSKRFGSTVFWATTRPDGRPHVVPVAAGWIDGSLTAFVLTSSVKVANVRQNPGAMAHWNVSEATGWDSLMIEGTATVVDDTPGRTSLWDRMGYDLSPFEPGGPSADSHVFLQLAPSRATLLLMYGIKGRHHWRAV